MKKEPAGRKTEYSVLRPDFFVISGLQGLKKFYVRAQLRGDEVRGFTVLYDQAMAGIMEPVVVAMSSAYAPFPAAPQRAAAAPQGRICQRRRGRARPHRDQPRRAGRLLCHHRRGHRRRGSRRRGQGERACAAARLWRGNLKPVALAGENAERRRDAARRRRSAGAGRRQRGQRREGARRPTRSRSIPRRRSASTARAALDAQGRLVGIAALKLPVVAGAAPSAGASATLTPVEAIRDFLDAQNVPRRHRASRRKASVRVICVGSAVPCRFQGDACVTDSPSHVRPGSPSSGAAPCSVRNVRSRTSPAASRRTPPCLPSDRASRTARGTCGARSGCPRRASSRTRG